jgi:hypothetical protein
MEVALQAMAALLLRALLGGTALPLFADSTGLRGGPAGAPRVWFWTRPMSPAGGPGREPMLLLDDGSG